MPSLVELIYDTPFTPRPARTAPMRVICPGPSRSGTESLHRALTILGLQNPYHGFTISATPGAHKQWHRLGMKKYHSREAVTRDDFELLLSDCQGITDLVAFVHFADLMAAYPEAKIVLNTRRDLDKWFESHLNTVVPLLSKRDFGWLAYFSPWLYWRKRWAWEVYDAFWLHDFKATAIWRYREHCAMVRGMVPPERLLEWSVEDGWEPLCRFLDLPVPDEPFPQGNTPAGFHERIAKRWNSFHRRAWMNVALCGAGVCLAVAGTLKALDVF